VVEALDIKGRMRDPASDFLPRNRDQRAGLLELGKVGERTEREESRDEDDKP
jgi:hypothetical protein